VTQAKKQEARKGAVGSKVVKVRTRLDAAVRSRMIVAAAFKAIAREGFEGLRTRDIAKLVGINSATLHHHFPTKEDLIAAVADYLEDSFRTQKLEPGESESGIEALDRQLRDAIFYYLERPEMLAVYREFVSRAARDPSIRKLVQRLHGGWQADIVQAIRNGLDDGSIRAGLDVKAAAGIILSAVWGLVAGIFSSREEFDAGFRELLKWLVPEQTGTKRTRMMRRK
jgi:AcrR family transcriptional regulator